MGDGLEGEGLEGVAGEDGDGFAEDDMAGGLAAAEVVVVEGGKVVVNEGVGVDHLDGGAEVGCAFGDLAGAGDHACGFHAEDGAEALASGEGAVAHGAVDGVGFGGSGGKKAFERLQACNGWKDAVKIADPARVEVVAGRSVASPVQQTVMLHEEVLREITLVADRFGASPSATVNLAWLIAQSRGPRSRGAP